MTLRVCVLGGALRPGTAKLRIWMLRIWGFRGPGFRSARQVLCGDTSRLFIYDFAKHLGSVLGQTELCHEVRNPGPQKPQIIRNENHHVALPDKSDLKNKNNILRLKVTSKILREVEAH